MTIHVACVNLHDRVRTTILLEVNGDAVANMFQGPAYLI